MVSVVATGIVPIPPQPYQRKGTNMWYMFVESCHAFTNSSMRKLILLGPKGLKQNLTFTFKKPYITAVLIVQPSGW